MNDKLMKNYLESVLVTGSKIDSLDYIHLGIIEESGEIAGKVKKFYRGDYDQNTLRDNIKKEIGDLTWYLVLYGYKNGTLQSGFRSAKSHSLPHNIKSLEILKGRLAIAKTPRHKGIVINTMINTVTNLANNFNLTMEDICQTNIAKIRDRLLRNVLKGSGDER